MDVITQYYNRYMPESSVPRLVASDFKVCGSLKPAHSEGVTVVFFYVSQCRFCQDFAPEFSNFADNYAPSMSVTALAVDINAGDNRRLVSSSSNFPYAIGQTWPLIMVYYGGDPCYSYIGPRTAPALAQSAAYVGSVRPKCEFKYVECD